MGIFSTLNRALDRVDGAAATAIAGHGAQREARKFAATVRPGQTVYSVMNCNWPWGKGRLLKEWTFGNKRDLVTAQLKTGHLTAAGLWLGFGPIYTVRPGGLMTLEEYSRRGEYPPDAAEALRISDVQFTPARV